MFIRDDAEVKIDPLTKDEMKTVFDEMSTRSLQIKANRWGKRQSYINFILYMETIYLANIK